MAVPEEIALAFLESLVEVEGYTPGEWNELEAFLAALGILEEWQKE